VRRSSSEPGCGLLARRSDPWAGHSSTMAGAHYRAGRANRRHDLVAYNSTPRGGALCCDATVVSPLTKTGQPRPGAADTAGAVLRSLNAANDPHTRSCAPLARRSSSSWARRSEGAARNGEACRFVHHLLQIRSHKAPPALRRAEAAGWSRRWCGLLGVAVQQAFASTALGQAWPAPLHP